jgi:hypothetical protein
VAIAATSPEGVRVVHAVEAKFRALASTPRSGFGHGTNVIIAPICGSVRETSYVLVVATPYARIETQGANGIAEPAVVYVHLGGTADRDTVIAVLTGAILTSRPHNLPKTAFADLRPTVKQRCLPFAPSQLLPKIRARSEPVFQT